MNLDPLVINALVEQIAKGSCVVFLGTERAPLDLIKARRRDFTEDLARRSGYEDGDLNLEKVAEHFESTVDRPRLVEQFSTWIEKNWWQPSPVDLQIARLPVKVIVTTRTDLMIEEALRENRKKFEIIVDNQGMALSDAQRLLLIKVYGSIDYKDTLVISERDHFDNFANKQRLLTEIKSWFVTNSILFLEHDLDSTLAKLLHRDTVREVGKYVRRSYAVSEAISAPAIKRWDRDNVNIIQSEPLTVLDAVHRELAAYRPQARRAAERSFYATPYKFLDSYEVGDAGLFFGRKDDTNFLTREVLAHHLFVLFGSSGTGKTSLIRAGLIPELRTLDVLPIFARCLDAPLASVARAILAASENERGHSIEAGDLATVKLADLLKLCQVAVRKPIVLFIDQVEEVFRFQDNDQQNTFIQELASCLDEPALNLRLVLSVREDYFPELDGWRRTLPSIFNNTFRLGNLSSPSAVDAITRPLDLFEVKFEDELIVKLIEDLRADGLVAPAQLQIVCDALYRRHGQDKIITKEHYLALGGAGRILAAYLNKVLDQFPGAKRALVEQVLQALVNSRRAKYLLSVAEVKDRVRGELPAVANVLTDLEDARLVRKIVTPDAHKFEIVHDYIVHEIALGLSEEETEVKEIQEIVENETRLWPRFRTPISARRLEAIYRNWTQLHLGDAELELVLRSSVVAGFLGDWIKVAETSDNELIPLYVRLLDDEDIRTVNFAVGALVQVRAATPVELEKHLKSKGRARYGQKTLRALKSGRTIEEVINEINDPFWEKRHLLNTSSMVGVDFGTSSSAISVWRDGRPILIPNREGAKFTPSVVSISANGEVVVGTSAVLQATTNPDRTFFSIKRHLGTDLILEIDGAKYTPVDLAALILHQLKEDAETFLQREVSKVIATVPAYFNGVQRDALLSAFRQAGFDVQRPLTEPTAAAIAHGFLQRYDRTFAVYDLGGGTFDVSILNDSDGVYQVMAVNGDTNLGGVDFDERVVKYAVDEFYRDTGIDLSTDAMAMVRVAEAAERAKIALSGLEMAHLAVPYVAADASGIKHLNIELSRSRFEELTRDLIERTLRCCEDALKDAGSDNSEIDELVLVGLSTKMPAVREAVSRLFDKEPRPGVDPDEAVAFGAALQSAVLSGDEHSWLLLDATPLTLGIEITDDLMAPMIERNTTIPTRKSQTFTTVRDDQMAVEVVVLEGEATSASQNRELSRFVLDGISAAPQGMARIDVTFDIDADRIIQVTARDASSRRTRVIPISTTTRSKTAASAEQHRTEGSLKLAPVPDEESKSETSEVPATPFPIAEGM